MARPAEIRIGLSGWTYPPWRGDFYPPGLPQKDELRHVSRVFRSIEINGTFYSLQTPASFSRWAAETPDDFVFTVKGSRYITHITRLEEPEVPLANFLASGLLKLGRKLGAMLWQFPPNFRFEPSRLEPFFALLPKDTAEAARLARGHSPRMKGRTWTETDEIRRIRHAVEIRHESFVDPAFIALLRRHDMALVCADTVKWPRLMDLTSDFVYCRLHGSEELYRSTYTDEAIDRWTRRVIAWAAGEPMRDGTFVVGPDERPVGRDVFLFFDNTDKKQAPINAGTMMRRIAERTAAAP